MAEGITIITAGIIIGVMAYRLHRIRRDVDIFTQKVEECLDSMLLDKKPVADSSVYDKECDGDTLWGKVYERFLKLWNVQHARSLESAGEKKRIKELISDISHQTKTPIANLKMYQELLEEEKELTNEQQEFLRKMQSQTEKLDFLIQSMVKMSRLETGVIAVRCRNSRLCDTIGRAVSAVVKNAEKKHIRLYAECSEDIYVSHDSKWTEEAIFNLLDNAVKYTEEGGEIHILVRVQEIYTRICVKDNGKGIAPERQAEIFRRFYREPEVHDCEGIGVGLCLVREILNLQNGYVEVRSEPGKGSEFYVYLPNDKCENITVS